MADATRTAPPWRTTVFNPLGTCMNAELFTCGITSSGLAPKPRSRERGSLVVDMHCHMLVPQAEELIRPFRPNLPEPTQRFSSPTSRQVSGEMLTRIRDRITGVKQRLAQMDANEIDLQVISPAPNHYAYWADEELGRSMARMVNQHLAEVVAQHPDRLRAFATVPMQSPRSAVDELQHCVRELGMRGVEISSNVNGQELSDPQFQPFFAAAEALGVVVFIHPSGFTGGERLSDYHLNNVIGNPLDSTVALSHLIFSGTLDRFPRLKLLVAHGGGLMPAYSGRFDHAHYARADCQQCQHEPSHYLRRMYFDTVIFDPAQLAELVRKFGATQLLAGTDFPYDMEETALVDFVHRAGLGDEQTRQILGLNAARLLGIDPGQAAALARGAKG